MTTVMLPESSVVLIIGGRKASFAEVAARFEDAASCPWDIMKPDQALIDLHAAIAAHDQVRVCMAYSSGKARRAVSAAARKRGLQTICLRLPGAEDIDGDAERMAAVYDLTGSYDFDIRTVPMPWDRRTDHGPFDIIGDIHGCAVELMMLLVRLGHAVETDGHHELVEHPEGRRVILVGDLTDRGPLNLRSLEIAHELETRFGAIVELGNHDDKLRRWLAGSDVRIAAGLQVTIDELSELPMSERLRYAEWLGSLQTHHILDGGRLVVAHAGLAERYHGKVTPGAIAFALYGETTGKVDEEGTPITTDWALEYRGEAVVVQGHEVYREPRLLNGTVSIDTGCVFGNALTAYRWPEREFVKVDALKQYDVPHTRRLN